MNTTSPYNHIFNDTKCLSFDEITAYNSGNVSGIDQHRVEEHLLGCELCSAALTGFAAVPVASRDITDLHKKIDAIVKRKPWYSNSYFIAGLAVILFSVTFLLVSNPFKKKQDKPAPVIHHLLPSNDVEQFEVPPPPSIDGPTLKKVESIRVSSKENFVKPEITKGPQPPAAPGKNAALNDPAPKVNKVETKPAPAKEIEKEEDPVEIEYNAPVRYIEDLKVTDFEKLYTKPIDPRHTHSSVPAWLENENKKNDPDPFAETERSIPADEVLEKGLRSFKRGKWSDAMMQFNLLLSNNNKDVNALFYKGICAWNLNRSLIAQNCLMQVLASENNVFHQEARWYLALTYIKAGETDTARELLNMIISEKGFYREQAKKALKELN